MKTIEHYYNRLNEIVKFKEDLDFQVFTYSELSIKMIPSYNQQAYDLMNLASKCVLELDNYIVSDSSRFSEEEKEMSNKIKEHCFNCTKEHREKAFIILNECVEERIKWF